MSHILSISTIVTYEPPINRASQAESHRRSVDVAFTAQELRASLRKQLPNAPNLDDLISDIQSSNMFDTHNF
ncbi:hypothetical protein COLO4_33585 [Corchorus olitorius]|uniref:Uncharacterized protein n=1 Tax=Corchorus olitorius TaxID=93759 RepID=A0A1R3GSN9_9ROSI|nr:hypothetical protein COLO4_33585 [Corchorus olitorius]